MITNHTTNTNDNSTVATSSDQGAQAESSIRSRRDAVHGGDGGREQRGVCNHIIIYIYI